MRKAARCLSSSRCWGGTLGPRVKAPRGTRRDHELPFSERVPRPAFAKGSTGVHPRKGSPGPTGSTARLRVLELVTRAAFLIKRQPGAEACNRYSRLGSPLIALIPRGDQAAEIQREWFTTCFAEDTPREKAFWPRKSFLDLKIQREHFKEKLSKN